MYNLNDSLIDWGKYETLGGVYFPVLQQDGSRSLVKVASGNDAGSLTFLQYLRQHDRMPGKDLTA